MFTKGPHPVLHATSHALQRRRAAGCLSPDTSMGSICVFPLRRGCVARLVLVYTYTTCVYAYINTRSLFLFPGTGKPGRFPNEYIYTLPAVCDGIKV